MKVFYLDTETTGINPVKNDIIQLAGIVEIDGQVLETIKLHCQPFDYNAVEAEALQCHGITLEQIKTFPDPRETYRTLVGVLAKYVDKFNRADKFTLAGQKVGFDADFLKAFFEKNGDKYYGSWFNWRHVDLLAFTRILNYAGLLKTENDKLSTVAEVLGVTLEAHDALEDIQATRKLLKVMIEKYLRGGANDAQ